MDPFQNPSLKDQTQVPPVSQEHPTPEAEDPLEYIRSNTPGNSDPSSLLNAEISPNPTGSVEEEVGQQPSVSTNEVEKEESPEDLRQEFESLKQEVNFTKILLSDLLAGRKIKDFTDYPDDEPKILSGEGRKMILPLGIKTVRFGYMEFKKALEDAMSLDENTYVLRYISERPREDRSQPEPRLLKFTKEQIDKCYSKIQQEEPQTQIGGQQYQQPPESPPIQQF